MASHHESNSFSKKQELHVFPHDDSEDNSNSELLTCAINPNSKCGSEHSSHAIKLGSNDEQLYFFISPENIKKLEQGDFENITESLLLLSLDEILTEESKL